MTDRELDAICTALSEIGFRAGVGKWYVNSIIENLCTTISEEALNDGA